MNGVGEILCPGCFEAKGSASICPICGYDESLDPGILVLPYRTLLQGQFLIGKVLGKPGGFGITYLALDKGLGKRVAIKEFLPRELAGRDIGKTTVKALSREDAELFHRGLQDFLEEARRVAKFDHANIVRVRHVFEENGTAYMVMDYYEGVTLAEYLRNRGRLPEKTALDIIMPVLDGLREVHRMGWIHRDIKPQNVYLTTEGAVIILDFGLARHTIAEQSKSLSVVLTPGYAPFEQYHRRGQQGSWTDVYASGAVLYEIVTGQTPPDAPERFADDQLVPPKSIVPELSEGMSAGIMQALAVDFKRRLQTIEAFQNLLLAKSPPSAAIGTIGIRGVLWRRKAVWGTVALILGMLAVFELHTRQERARLEQQAQIEAARRAEEAEKQRQAEEEARKQAEQEQAEAKRQAEAQKRLEQQQELEAEKRRLEEERRQAELVARQKAEAEEKKQAELEAEKGRQAKAAAANRRTAPPQKTSRPAERDIWDKVGDEADRIFKR